MESDAGISCEDFAPAPEAEAPSDPFETLMEEPDLNHAKIDHGQDADEQFENK